MPTISNDTRTFDNQKQSQERKNEHLYKLNQCLAEIQREGCYVLTTAWIKLIDPNKSLNYPYKRGGRIGPPWWPVMKLKHTRPSVLKLDDLITLLVHIAGLVIQRDPSIPCDIDVALLDNITQTATDSWRNQNAENCISLARLFEELYEEERYRQDENKVNNFLPCQTQAANPEAQEYNFCIGNTYIGHEIGRGAFGIVFRCTIISGKAIAIKFEDIKVNQPRIEHEARIYKTLAGGVGIPCMHWFITEHNYHAMAIDLLGPNLECYLNLRHRTFSLKTILLLADQLISRAEYIHTKSFIYRDFKPENIVMGIENSNVLHMIDFGNAKEYLDPKTGLHIPCRENKSLTGTSTYVSINTHLGLEQSRRDDMESIGYILVYFYHGSLPWGGITAPTLKQKYDSIMEKKMAITIEKLCNGMPDEFATFLRYNRSLHFEEKPDYSYLRGIFRNLFACKGFEEDYVFDWTLRGN